MTHRPLRQVVLIVLGLLLVPAATPLRVVSGSSRTLSAAQQDVGVTPALFSALTFRNIGPAN